LAPTTAATHVYWLAPVCEGAGQGCARRAGVQEAATPATAPPPPPTRPKPPPPKRPPPPPPPPRPKPPAPRDRRGAAAATRGGAGAGAEDGGGNGPAGPVATKARRHRQGSRGHQGPKPPRPPNPPPTGPAEAKAGRRRDGAGVGTGCRLQAVRSRPRHHSHAGQARGCEPGRTPRPGTSWQRPYGQRHGPRTTGGQHGRRRAGYPAGVPVEQDRAPHGAQNNDGAQGQPGPQSGAPGPKQPGPDAYDGANGRGQGDVVIGVDDALAQAEDEGRDHEPTPPKQDGRAGVVPPGAGAG